MALTILESHGRVGRRRNSTLIGFKVILGTWLSHTVGDETMNTLNLKRIGHQIIFLAARNFGAREWVTGLSNVVHVK